MITRDDVKHLKAVTDLLMADLNKLEKSVTDYRNAHANDDDNRDRYLQTILGLVGIIKSHITTMMKFQDNLDEDDLILDTAEKRSTINIGIPYVLDKFPPLAEKVKIYFNEDKKENESKLCDTLLNNVKVLKTEIEELKKKPHIKSDLPATPLAPK